MGANHVERAYRAWTILVRCAKQRRPITYGDLAKELGIHHRPIRYVLGVIQDYCMEENLPPLTILVESQKGLPGSGFIAHDFNHLDEGKALVYAFPWSSIENPFQFACDGASYDSIIQDLLADPDNSEDVYARIKVRGVKQIVFREALLKAYGERCAFTGISFKTCLEAAHIVPWRYCSAPERMDVRNGILLNSLHHKLFDKGYITVTSGYRIVYCDPEQSDGYYSSFDSLVSSKLHGKIMEAPRKIANRPLSAYLDNHHQRHDWQPQQLAF